MKKKTVFSLHFSALSALFVLGNGVIIFPKPSADDYTFLGYLSAVAVALFLYFCLDSFIVRLYSYEALAEDKGCKQLPRCALYFFTAIACLWYSAEAFLDFSKFANTLMLQDFPMLVSVVLFLIASLYFISRRQEDFLKFALLSFCVTAAIIIFFFIASFSNLRPQNIIILETPSISELYLQAREYIFNPMLSFLLLAVYEACVFKKPHLKSATLGGVFGFSLLGICILNSVLLFGARFAALLDYPYASAVSTVTIGRLFTRLDGLSYFVYFSACVTKITVCAFILKTMLKKINSLLICSK